MSVALESDIKMCLVLVVWSLNVVWVIMSTDLLGALVWCSFLFPRGVLLQKKP
jgi:hypothetical protein